MGARNLIRLQCADHRHVANAIVRLVNGGDDMPYQTLAVEASLTEERLINALRGDLILERQRAAIADAAARILARQP